MPTVVVVDDEIDMRMLVRMALERGGFEVVAEAADGTSGLDVVIAADPPAPDVILLDNRMPGVTGVQLAAECRRARPEVPVVLFSAHLDEDTRTAAAEAGVVQCVSKTDLRRLPVILRQVLAS